MINNIFSKKIEGLVLVRALSRLSNKKIFLAVVVLVIALGVGYVMKPKKHISNSPQPGEIVAKYVSLGGDYLFSIPAKYTTNETAINGVTLVYPDSLNISGKNLDELYKADAVAVQSISALKDDNAEAFKSYVRDTLANELRKNLHTGSDIRFAKQNGVEALKLFALTNDGKHRRAIYALNYTQPVMLVAKDETDALKIVGSSIEDYKKSKLKTDIDQAALTTKAIVEMLQKQDTSGIATQSTDDFNKNAPKDRLAGELKTADNYLKRSIIIVGGSYNSQGFAAQLMFEPVAKDQSPGSGLVSLRKQGNSWKLDALQLPK